MGFEGLGNWGWKKFDGIMWEDKDWVCKSIFLGIEFEIEEEDFEGV